MRLLLTSLCSALALFASTGPSLAFVSGAQEKLLFISDVEEMDFSLCHRVTAEHMIFILGMGFESEGYALAEDQCNSDYYYPVTMADFLELRASGAIPADTPITPEVTGMQNFQLHSGWLVGLIFLLGAIGTAIRNFFFAAGGGNTKIFRSILCRAALTNGPIGDQTASLIAAILKKATGKSVSAKALIACGSQLRQSNERADFSKAANILKPQQKIILMRSVLLLLEDNGGFLPEGQRFIERLAQALSIAPDVFRNMIGQLQS